MEDHQNLKNIYYWESEILSISTIRNQVFHQLINDPK